VSTADPLAPLRPYVLNTLPVVSAARVAGVVGDHPSLYSRSPVMWNAAFAALGVPAAYLAFDVPPDRVERFLDGCRAAPALLGFSVTVPYKERILQHLDAVDADAEATGAVNVVLRTPEGTFLGGNTDGGAVVQAVRRLRGAAPADDRSHPLLLIGAGGAARAAGVAVAREMPGTPIVLCNRGRDRAAETAEVIRRAGGDVVTVRPDELDEVVTAAGVLVNATSVGMAGPIHTADGITWLEPFSPLGPADSPLLVPARAAGARPPAEWWPRAWPQITRNLEVSLRRALGLRSGAAVLDLIYAPAETVLLKHARWTGHAAANGLGVLVGQAVEAFALMCRPLLPPAVDVRTQVAAAMADALR
jgi:shikimate dehydrogenase